MWGELAKDAPGILLFLAWLVLPPLYHVVIGRKYARQCADAAQEAVWAREELRQALEDVEDLLTALAPSGGTPRTELPIVPRARDYRPDDTQEFGPVEDSTETGRHRLARSPLADVNA